jgi:hypothetical protein
VTDAWFIGCVWGVGWRVEERVSEKEEKERVLEE